MTDLEIPSQEVVSELCKRACFRMASRFGNEESDGFYKRLVCAACDSIVTVDNTIKWIESDMFAAYVRRTKGAMSDLKDTFPENVINDYRVSNPLYNDLCVSKFSSFRYNTQGQEEILVCNACHLEFIEIKRKYWRRKGMLGRPSRAIWNGNLIGDLPKELQGLSIAEVALISPSRIMCHGIVLYADQHKGIYGWHAMYENDVTSNVANIRQISEVGLGSEIVCVLCGPFSKIHRRKANSTMVVRYERIRKALQWLQENNHFYKDIVIPNENEIPTPRILFNDDYQETNDNDAAQIENEINISVVFPDKDSTNAFTGGFKTKEEFRKFLCTHGNKRVEHQFFSRPTKNQVLEYIQDNFVASLPLQFPYGFGGLPKQKHVKDFLGKKNTHESFEESIKRLLRHRRLEFHTSAFNLFANDRLMKDKLFLSARLQCNLRYEDAYAMGEKYGTMSAATLEKAITKARQETNSCDSNVGSRFLNSVNAICSDLPHSNEATLDARSKYFSYLVKFGLPALFVTISPDDQRSAMISIYALRKVKKFWTNEPSTKDKDESVLIASFKKRCNDRTQYPGLCAEAYMAIIESFINDFLNWDTHTNQAQNIGLFGWTEAFTLATEEQGRKSLHGHFLIWIRGWNALYHRIMQLQKFSSQQQDRDVRLLKRYVEHCSSSRIFQDFDFDGVFLDHAVFKHESCRTPRSENRSRFTVNPADSKQLAEMRHKRKHGDHRGNIAKCPKCNRHLSIDNICKNALNFLDSSCDGTSYEIPDSNRRLEQLVFEMELDTSWCEGPAQKKAKRLFVANVHSNIHRHQHSSRCFKSSDKCYANLPEEPRENTTLTFSPFVSTWSDWHGIKHDKNIFEVKLQRNIEDVYTNTHNRCITMCYLCNNNIACAMTGASVCYCTCYNTKQTQKEEKKAYEAMASTLLRVLKHQDENPNVLDGITPSQVGMRRLLMAIYRHTSSLVIAGPMAHYLALQGSRYRFSHELSYLPIGSLSRILRNEPTSMHMARIDTSKRVPFCRALNYIFRPTQFEHMCPYEFFTTIDVIQKEEAKGKEFFDFLEDHPKYGQTVCVYAEFEYVPNLNWNFFGDAKCLETPLFLSNCLHRRHEKQITREGRKFEEEFSRKFLLCFTSYRNESDLTIFGSYKARLQQAMEHKQLSQYIEFMQNIQNIRNSLDAGRMTNDVPGYDLDATDNITQEQDEENLGTMDLIANYFISSTHMQKLNEEPKEFNFPEAHFKNQCEADNGDIWEGIPNNIFCTASTTQDTSEIRIRTFRESSSLTSLNYLLQSSFLMTSSEDNTQSRTIKATGSVESIIAYGMAKQLDLDQQTAFEILTATFVLTYVEDIYIYHKDENNNDPSDEFRSVEEKYEKLKSLAQVDKRNGEPLRLFITGPAGAGKSNILNALMDYAQQFTTQLEGVSFDRGVIRLTALTGSAATEIKGSTIHRVCKLSAKTKIQPSDIDEWLNSRLLIIDEISFADHDSVLQKISANLQKLTNDQSRLYGRISICFIGDFLQLEPVRGKAAYEFYNSVFWEQALNCFVELNGLWRFKNCPHLQKAFPILRTQGMTDEIRNMFNQRVIGSVQQNGGKLKMPDVRFTKVATFSNKNREDANSAIFDTHIRKYHSMNSADPIPNFTVIVKGHMKWANTQRQLSFTERYKVFTEVKEHNVRLSEKNTKQLSPFLRLFYKMQVMCTENEDVDNGIANGTTATFEYLGMKPGASLHKIKYNGYWVYAVNAEDVEYMQLRWCDSTFHGTFRMKPKTKRCTVSMSIEDFGKSVKIDTKIDIMQFMVTINHATTGHKLQGKSVDKLIVQEWSNRRNWIYVVLSRVRTLDGLFLMRPLPEDTNTTPPIELSQMLQRLRDKLSVRQDSPEISFLRQTVQFLNVSNNNE